jgi:hypothetical protein
MTRLRRLCFIILFVLGFGDSTRVFAQAVNLPNVQWITPEDYLFKLDDQVVLRLSANVPMGELHVRLFKRSKKELQEWIERKKGQDESCIIIVSEIHVCHKPPFGNECALDWYPDLGSLNHRPDGGNDDKYYTVVFEEDFKGQEETFRLERNYVEKYFGKNFEKGLEIKISADGVRDPKLKLWQSVLASVHHPDGTSTDSAAQPSSGTGERPAAIKVATKAPDCIRVRTLSASESPNIEPEKIVAQLVAEPCYLVGQPLRFDLPTGSLRTAWILR